jgi:transposase
VTRTQALDESLSRVAREPGFWPLVARLRAFRGLDTLSALMIVLEVADFTRVARAVQLGSWLGLVPSRQQSGESDMHGSITKTRSRYARRILVEAVGHDTRRGFYGLGGDRAESSDARRRPASRALPQDVAPRLLNARSGFTGRGPAAGCPARSSLRPTRQARPPSVP